MKLSANEEYGLRCLVRLGYAGQSHAGEGDSLTIPEISHAEGVSPAYAAKILRLLRKGGFVKAARGKLKLREQPPSEAWLIHYEREAESGLMLSHYEIAPVADAEGTRAMLARALGVLAEVRKHRELLTWRNVRLHLDRVVTLGAFGEIEAVLDGRPREDASALSERVAIDELLAAFGVGAGDLIDVSYFELMTRS